MANVSPKLTIPFTIGTGQIVGQGNYPELVAMVSFSDMSVAIPVWTDVSARVRGFSVNRGRSDDLVDFDTGTASVTLDNRDRAFEPLYSASPYYPNVRPWNRLWLREQFTGETQELFKGYVESYPVEWPAGGSVDAVVTVGASDEFKPLSLDTLPVTNPPRDSYANLVAFDSPQGYWPMGDDPATVQQGDVAGPEYIFTPAEDPGPPLTRKEMQGLRAVGLLSRVPFRLRR